MGKTSIKSVANTTARATQTGAGNRDESRGFSSFLRGVEEAGKAIRAVFDKTPLQRNAFLSDRHGAEILLKREDLTPVRSYKLRGAFNFFRKAMATQSASETTSKTAAAAKPRAKSARAKPARAPASPRFVCASAGNHAQGFAFSCQHFDVDGVVFMPVTTPQQKIDKTRVFGGDRVTIKLVGDIFDECNQAALEFAETHGAEMVPPFDHPFIIEGQASVGLEILEQAPGPIDLLIVPVGGGGLAAGVTKVFQELSPQTQIRYVEPEGAPSFKESLRAGKRVKLKKIDSFVDGAAVAMIGAHNFKALKSIDPEDVILIPEDRLCETMVEMLNVEGIVLEPAGALEVDALRSFTAKDLKGKRVVCLTSGGNFDFERLPEVKERALKAAGLKKYYILRLPQRPGALRDFLDLLGPDDDIARFEYLKKSARNFGSILVGVETTDKANFGKLNRKMEAAGLQFQDITDDEVVAAFII